MNNDEQLHPMVRKARQEFKESLESGKPLRWLMINRKKIRTVQEAFRMAEKYCSMYTDIAEEQNAEMKIQSELVYERQTVLNMKKSEAIRTLSEWYDRPKTKMTFRYQKILEEAEKIPEAVLMAEKDEFIRERSAMSEPEPAVSLQDEARPGYISIDDFSSLAMANLQKRIDGLFEEESALGMELADECGKLKKIREKITEVKNKISSIETAYDEIKKGLNQ